MDDTATQPSLPGKVVLAAVGLLAAASLAVALYIFMDLRSKSVEWNSQRAALERKIADVEEERRALRSELEQMESAGREADEASRRLSAIEEEIRRRESVLGNLAQRTVTTQAGLDRALKRRQALGDEIAAIERQLDQTASRLAPLAAELESRTAEYRELQAVLKQARDGLDRAIQRFESLGAGSADQ